MSRLSMGGIICLCLAAAALALGGCLPREGPKPAAAVGEKAKAASKRRAGEKKKAAKKKPPSTPPVEFSREHPYLRLSLPAVFRAEGGRGEEPGLLLRASGGPQGPRLVIRARPLAAPVTYAELSGGLLKQEQDRLYRLLKGVDFGPVSRAAAGGLPGLRFPYRAGGRSFLRYLLPSRHWLYAVTLSGAGGKAPEDAAGLLDSLKLVSGRMEPAPAPKGPLSAQDRIRALIYTFDPPAMEQARRRVRDLRKANRRDQSLVSLQAETAALQSLALAHMGKSARPVDWRGLRARAVSAWRAAPRDSQALRGLGLAKLMEGAREKAGKYLRAALKEAPAEGANHLALALWSDNPAERAALAQGALDTGFTHPAARLVLGWALEDLGRRAEAGKHYQAVLGAFPDNLPALAGLGRVKMEAPEGLDQAANLLGRALSLDPGDPRLCFDLALVRQMQGRHQEAQRLAQEVLNVQPADAPALNLKGLALRAQGKYRQAEAAYQAAVKADPQHAQAYYNLGALYAAILKDKLKAYEAFKKFLSLEIKGPRAEKVRAWIIKQGG